MGKLLLLKKGSALAAAAAVVLAGTAGCGETTNTEIVRYKTQDSEARMVEAGEFENIRSQVAAPERYRTNLHDQNNMMYVNVDASIQIPDAEGVRIKRVEARPFEQADYDAVHKAVMHNAGTWTGGYYPETGEPPMTREEAVIKAQELEKISDKLLSGDADMLSKYSIDSVTEQLKYLYGLLDSGPEVFETEPVDITITYSEDAAKRQWYMYAYGVSSEEERKALSSEITGTVGRDDAQLPEEEEKNSVNNSSVNSSAAEEEVVGKGEEQEAETETYNDQSANFEMDGMQYAIYIGNSLSEYNKYINMRVQRDGADYVGLWMMSDDDQINVEQTLSLEEAEKMADETVRAMGLDDMELAYTDAGYSQRYSESDFTTGTRIENQGYESAYVLVYTRTIDNFPTGYTFSHGNTVEIQGTIPYTLYWPYEMITMAYDKDGLLSFEWTGPYKVSELSEEYVFLLPFSEIQNIFESIILKKNADYAEQGIVTEMNVDKVTLSYMRIWEDSARGDATLIPVWNFFGTYHIVGDSYEQPNLITPGTSLLTINAMDGTIVDVDRGY